MVGSTGSGKTVLANTLIGAAISVYPPSELRLFVSSGKEEDIIVWDGVPHLLYKPSHDSREVVAMLSWAKMERERRSHLPARDKGLLPHIVIYIGEISALLGGAGASEMEILLDDLLCMGRSSKIHLWVTTQRPTGKKVGSSDAKGQFKLVLCGAMQNPQDAYIALGMGKSGAEFLPNKGAFITNNGTRFQAAFLGDDEHPEQINDLVATARGKWGEPEYIELDVAAVGDVESSNLTQDILDVVNTIRSNNLTELAKSYISTVMGWGYNRANRVWLELERVGVILPRESKNVPAQLDLEVMNKEYGKG
jgi:DNA segregation ATPase FtsK/SpoIIIE-like protein